MRKIELLNRCKRFDGSDSFEHFVYACVDSDGDGCGLDPLIGLKQLSHKVPGLIAASAVFSAALGLGTPAHAVPPPDGDPVSSSGSLSISPGAGRNSADVTDNNPGQAGTTRGRQDGMDTDGLNPNSSSTYSPTVSRESVGGSAASSISSESSDNESQQIGRADRHPESSVSEPDPKSDASPNQESSSNEKTAFAADSNISRLGGAVPTSTGNHQSESVRPAGLPPTAQLGSDDVWGVKTRIGDPGVHYDHYDLEGTLLSRTSRERNQEGTGWVMTEHDTKGNVTYGPFDIPDEPTSISVSEKADTTSQSPTGLDETTVTESSETDETGTPPIEVLADSVPAPGGGSTITGADGSVKVYGPDNEYLATQRTRADGSKFMAIDPVEENQAKSRELDASAQPTVRITLVDRYGRDIEPNKGEDPPSLYVRDMKPTVYADADADRTDGGDPSVDAAENDLNLPKSSQAGDGAHTLESGVSIFGDDRPAGKSGPTEPMVRLIGDAPSSETGGLGPSSQPANEPFQSNFDGSQNSTLPRLDLAETNKIALGSVPVASGGKIVRLADGETAEATTGQISELVGHPELHQVVTIEEGSVGGESVGAGLVQAASVGRESEESESAEPLAPEDASSPDTRASSSSLLDLFFPAAYGADEGVPAFEPAVEVETKPPETSNLDPSDPESAPDWMGAAIHSVSVPEAVPFDSGPVEGFVRPVASRFEQSLADLSRNPGPTRQFVFEGVQGGTNVASDVRKFPLSAHLKVGTNVFMRAATARTTPNHNPTPENPSSRTSEAQVLQVNARASTVGAELRVGQEQVENVLEMDLNLGLWHPSTRFYLSRVEVGSETVGEDGKVPSAHPGLLPVGGRMIQFALDGDDKFGATGEGKFPLPSGQKVAAAADSIPIQGAVRSAERYVDQGTGAERIKIGTGLLTDGRYKEQSLKVRSLTGARNRTRILKGITGSGTMLGVYSQHVTVEQVTGKRLQTVYVSYDPADPAYAHHYNNNAPKIRPGEEFDYLDAEIGFYSAYFEQATNVIKDVSAGVGRTGSKNAGTTTSRALETALGDRNRDTSGIMWTMTSETGTDGTRFGLPADAVKIGGTVLHKSDDDDGFSVVSERHFDGDDPEADPYRDEQTSNQMATNRNVVQGSNQEIRELAEVALAEDPENDFLQAIVSGGIAGQIAQRGTAGVWPGVDLATVRGIDLMAEVQRSNGNGFEFPESEVGPPAPFDRTQSDLPAIKPLEVNYGRPLPTPENVIIASYRVVHPDGRGAVPIPTSDQERVAELFERQNDPTALPGGGVVPAPYYVAVNSDGEIIAPDRAVKPSEIVVADLDWQNPTIAGSDLEPVQLSGDRQGLDGPDQVVAGYAYIDRWGYLTPFSTAGGPNPGPPGAPQNRRYQIEGQAIVPIGHDGTALTWGEEVLPGDEIAEADAVWPDEAFVLPHDPLQDRDTNTTDDADKPTSSPDEKDLSPTQGRGADGSPEAQVGGVLSARIPDAELVPNGLVDLIAPEQQVISEPVATDQISLVEPPTATSIEIERPPVVFADTNNDTLNSNSGNPLVGPPRCENNSDPDGDGFGLENGQLCLVPPANEPAQIVSTHTAGEEIRVPVCSDAPAVSDYLAARDTGLCVEPAASASS